MGEARVLSARISSLAHSTEDVEKVIEAMMHVFPFDSLKNVRTNRTKGHFGNEIVLCRFFETRHRADQLFDNLWERLSKQDKSRVYDEFERRVGRSGTLYLRLNKQEAFEGRLSLGDDEPVKVELQFRASVRSPESIVELIKKRMERLKSEIESDP